MSFDILVVHLTNDEQRILGLPPDLDMAKLKSEFDHRKVELEICESEYRWPDPPAIERLSRIMGERNLAAKQLAMSRRVKNIKPPKPILLLRSIAAITGLIGITLTLGFTFRESYREWERQTTYLREMRRIVKSAQQGAGSDWPQIMNLYHRPVNKQLQIVDNVGERVMNRAYAVAISTFITFLGVLVILFDTILGWED